jgi:glycosyltransferase involved in cell wall biosynthesis
MRLLANKIIVYTHSQKQELELRMPNKKIYSAPNALYKKNEMLTNNSLKTIKNIIYVGRLTKKKKPLIMVKAFEIALKKLSKNVNLLIIGDGEEKQNIIEYVNNNKIASRVSILGHIGSYSELRELYHSSLVSLSPGYVGLSATQSLGFGVPMLVSRNENHSPEIESIKEGANALFFETNSEKNLSDKLLEMFNNQYYWIKQRELICEDCKGKYSIESMAEPFINLLKI